MIQSGPSCKTYDTAIIGAGVLGLWAARHAIKRGEKVIVIEKRQVGAGASGGFLGALMPHMPDNWNAKKQFQYDGLTSLSDTIADLEDDTGVDCGYRQCGRIMPLLHEKVLPQVERRIVGAQENWGGELELNLRQTQGEENLQTQGEGRSIACWLNPELAKCGIQYDTLSARINPRTYLRALDAFVRPRVELLEQTETVGLSSSMGEVQLSTGETVSAGKIIVANGWEAYPLLQSFMGDLNSGKPIGRGVKGQAVLVEYHHDDNLPIVYHDGVYVVPHAGNRVAIGSTSINDWSGAPNAFKNSDMEFYERAISMTPLLKSAPIVEKWAGVRPRNTIDGRGTSPWFGPIPAHENLIALIGGFKITLGVAHLDFHKLAFTI